MQKMILTKVMNRRALIQGLWPWSFGKNIRRCSYRTKPEWLCH